MTIKRLQMMGSVCEMESGLMYFSLPLKNSGFAFIILRFEGYFKKKVIKQNSY